MRIAIATMICCLWLAAGSRVFAQTETDTSSVAPEVPTTGAGTATPAGSASITNPAISVIAWLQAIAGNDHAAQEDAFEFKEAELALQSTVDPYARGDFFISVGTDAVELEEGYLTWLALPGGGQAKVGKFRCDFGKFNRTHPPETPFADRPLAAETFLGEEGLTTAGVSLSAVLPNPLDLYWDVTGNLGTSPDSLDSPLYQAGERSDLLALARTSVFVPMGESADWNLGLSYANGPANSGLQVEGSRAQLGGADVTFRWKNPRRSIYRSLLAQVELMLERGSASGASSVSGGFGYVIYQFARRWKVGARYDRTETPGAEGHTVGGLALLQFQPSEFSTLSLQGRRVREPDDRKRDAVFLKWTFNIGPHGAHPY